MYKDIDLKIDKKLVARLDNIIKRLEKKDAWIILTGKEGDGKTNVESLILYYLHQKTGRPLSINNFHYDSEALIKEAQNDKAKLYGWDEGAIGGLSTQWQSKSQQDLIQFGMTSRVLHHVIVICIPRFEKLKDYIRERACCVIHCRQKNGQYRIIYISEKKKERMLNYMTKYKKISFARFKSFGCTVPNVFDKVFDEKEKEAYEKRKIDMIKQIGTKPLKPSDEKRINELEKLKYAYATIEGMTDEQKANRLGLTISALKSWRNRYKDQENQGLVAGASRNIVNMGLKDG